MSASLSPDPVLLDELARVYMRAALDALLREMEADTDSEEAEPAVAPDP
jgi:hypothetical protein